MTTSTSNNMPSSVLLYGDSYLSKNLIKKAKIKYSDASWVELSAKEDEDADTILSEMSRENLDGTQKIVLVHSLANRKNMREFFLRIATVHGSAKVLLWDSDGSIKIDPKTNTISSSAWKKFVDDFSKIGKVVNSGCDFTIKQSSSCVDYVKDCFKKQNHSINHDAAELFVKLVGTNRGLITSEIEKLCLVAQQQIDTSFILEHTFVTANEAVLYVFSNALDKNSVGECICLVEEFINNGVNENVIAEILMNKARWQLIVADLFNKNMEWNEISNKLIGMGKFPSCSKNKIDTLEEGVRFLCTDMKMHKKYFDKNIDSKSKLKKGAALPMPFMAHDIIQFAKQILNNIDSVNKSEAQQYLIDRALKVYQRTHNGLVQIRMGNAVMDNIYSMIRILKA